MMTLIYFWFRPQSIEENFSGIHLAGGVHMGRDRQEKKLRKSGRVESDRDQALHYPGATKLQSPEEARKLNDGKYS
jgi:hypothetical protein